MLPTIQIKDNFLDKKKFKILKNYLNKIHYVAIKNDCGNFGFRHYFEKNLDNEWLFKKIKEQFFPNTNLQPVSSSFHLRNNTNKVLDHRDKQDYNFLLYLEGRELLHNGTGFYTKNNIHTSIGFVKNRALFFDGKNNIHTDLQALGESSFRHTINIFYNYDK